MIKNRFVACALFVILFLAFWNAADWLYSTFITRWTWHFDADRDLAIPAAAAITLWVLRFLWKKKE